MEIAETWEHWGVNAEAGEMYVTCQVGYSPVNVKKVEVTHLKFLSEICR